MPKAILIPTDYSIRSLHILKHALRQEHATSLDIVFFTGIVLQSSISDLLFFSKRGITESMMTTEFKEACAIIRNRYSAAIGSMRFEIFTGFTQAAFNNFIEGHRIEEVYIPENKLRYEKRCFDATPYMQKCEVKKISVSWSDAQETSQPNHLNELFTSWT